MPAPTRVVGGLCPGGLNPSFRRFACCSTKEIPIVLRTRARAGRRRMREKRRWRGERRVRLTPRARRAMPACSGVGEPPASLSSVWSRNLHEKRAQPTRMSTHGVVRRLRKKSQPPVRQRRGRRRARRPRLRTKPPALAAVEEAAGRGGKKGLMPVPLSAHLVNFCCIGIQRGSETEEGRRGKGRGGRR